MAEDLLGIFGKMILPKYCIPMYIELDMYWI
jgi:hypothetical protein